MRRRVGGGTGADGGKHTWVRQCLTQSASRRCCEGFPHAFSSSQRPSGRPEGRMLPFPQGRLRTYRAHQRRVATVTFCVSTWPPASKRTT